MYRCCAEEEYKNDKCTSPNANIENVGANPKDGVEGFPIDFLPLEVLYLIIEKLDTNTFVNCLLLSKKWKFITLSIANADKTNLRWKSIFDSYHQEETFRVKSCGLPYKELFANSLRWNLDFTISLFGSCLVKHIKKINIYRDNIIVIDYDGVKYFDVHKRNIKKQLEISQCIDFNERDAFVLMGTQVQNNEVSQCKLFLYGKSKPDDDAFELSMQRIINFGDPGMNHGNSIMIDAVSHYAIENNTCYVMNACNSTLASYIWKDNKWEVCNLGRFYGNRDDNLYAMNVLHTEVFLLIKWGQMLQYSYEKRNFREVSRVRMPPNKNVFVRMVHKYCLVIGVPGNCTFNITRMRNNDGYNFYKIECPDLTCVTQHGEMLLLGHSNGMIQILMPRAPFRDDIFKRQILISEFISGPFEPEDLIVISIDVFEDFQQHYLFIATHSAVYQLVIKHIEETCIWNNIPEKPVYYKYPIRTRNAH